MSTINYPVGAYIVLLSVCGKKQLHSGRGSIPTDWVYILKNACTGTSFYPILDPSGSTKNGYSSTSTIIELRLATQDEIEQYLRLGKPYDIRNLVPAIKNNYEIY